MEYIAKYTGEMSKKEKEIYYSIFEEVFGTEVNIRSGFEKKYTRNIYGQSLVVFCYLNEKCVAIQSFLRNDLNGKLAYESGDSATLKEYRGKGIFTQLVKKGLEVLPKDAIVYGFPNNNSLPAFEKMGWHIGERKKTGLYLRSMRKQVEFIDQEYFKWIIANNSKLFYCKEGNKYLIVSRKCLNAYQIIGYIDEIPKKDILKNEVRLKRAKLPILFMHCLKGTYGVGMIPICTKEKDIDEILLHKLDVYLVS